MQSGQRYRSLAVPGQTISGCSQVHPTLQGHLPFRANQPNSWTRSTQLDEVCGRPLRLQILHCWLDSSWTRWRLGEEHQKETPATKNVMEWAENVSKAMTKMPFHGVIMGRALRTFKPPNNTVGKLITWLQGGKLFSVQEHKNSNHLRMKKVSNYSREEICIIYFYYYLPGGEAHFEPKPQEPTIRTSTCSSATTATSFLATTRCRGNGNRQCPEEEGHLWSRHQQQPWEEEGEDCHDEEGHCLSPDLLHQQHSKQDHPGFLRGLATWLWHHARICPERHEPGVSTSTTNQLASLPDQLQAQQSCLSRKKPDACRRSWSVSTHLQQRLDLSEKNRDAA